MTSDIKPERSNVVSSKGKKGIGGSSLLFVSFLSLLNLGGLVILGLWFFNNSDYQQETGENFSERIGSLEESVLTSKEASVESFASLEDKDKFLDRQVRLLWDLSNKRNKRDITTIKAKLKEIEESFDALKGQMSPISAKQRASDLEIAKLEKSLEKLRTSLTDLSAESNIDFEKRIKNQEEAISSIDAFRRQINSNILSLQRQMDELRKDLNNSSLE
tara:strand:+ start:203 stop:856 length:654 start_codon:yes stop_codon:yes gene_type:complete